jgi:uncharacterized membrane protein
MVDNSFVLANSMLFIILGMVKASKGERFDVPLISGLALKLMGSF